MRPENPRKPDEITAESLVADVRRLAGGRCPACATSMAPADVLMSLAMGFRDRPSCFLCLARNLHQPPEELRRWLLGYFRQRECFRDAWAWVTQQASADLSPGSGPAG